MHSVAGNSLLGARQTIESVVGHVARDHLIVEQILTVELCNNKISLAAALFVQIFEKQKKNWKIYRNLIKSS